MWEITMITVLAFGGLLSIVFRPKKQPAQTSLTRLEFEELTVLIDRAQNITKGKNNKPLDRWLLGFYQEEMYR